jgi:hypothetical protein
MIPNIEQINDRQIKGLTGVGVVAFLKLLPVFTISYQEIEMEAYEENREKRQRKPGGGQKGKLNTMVKKLFFILYYLKVYPTFDVMGFHFGMDHSKACTNVHKLLPVLIRTLDKLGMLPKRQFESVEEMQEAFAGIADLFVDATERSVHRPKDDQEQRQKFSGKKRRHTVKQTVISTASQMILFLGYVVFGSRHDYGLFKEEFPPDQDWFENFRLWVDLGYLEIQKDFKSIETRIPHKKPRKSKANPNPVLTEEQKQENRQMSKLRVVVENAIGRMKYFRCLTHIFRNRKDNLVDDVALIAAGLSNWMLSLDASATS